VKAFSGLSNDVEIFADTWAWRPLSTVAARAGVEKHIAEASAASTSRVLGMWVDLWAVTCPTVAPCGGRDEAVKVTKGTVQHVRMKLTKPHRSRIIFAFKMHRKLLNKCNKVRIEKNPRPYGVHNFPCFLR
jgi:hypothetical protein